MFSMLFIVLIGYWYGIKVGILPVLYMGFFSSSRSHMSFHFFRYDYILAFEPWAFWIIYKIQKNMVFLKAYIIAILARGAFHALGGYLYWMDYMPDTFEVSDSFVSDHLQLQLYSSEGVLMIVVISIPAVSSALGRMRIMATGGNGQICSHRK